MAKINTLNYQTVASWNGSRDLFVVEQPDGTKVATPAMVKQYVLNDMDEVPTEGSNKPVKSGGVKTYADSVLDALNTYQSGDWTVRKYNDGAFECWQHYEKLVSANTVDLNTYLNLPSEIISTPECITLGLIAGGADLYAVHMERKTSTQIRLAMINRHTAAAKIGVDVHVYGRWKN